MKKYFLSFGLIFIILSIVIFFLFINVFASGEEGRTLVNLLKQADSSVKAGEFQEAVDLYLQALEISPDDVDILLHLGNIYLWTGEFERAEKMLTRVINITPEYEDAYQSLSNVYLNQGMIQEAIDVLKRLIKRNPERVEVMVKVITLYHKLGDYTNARSVLRELQEKGIPYELPLGIQRDLYAWRCDIGYTYEKIDLIPDWNETVLSVAYCWKKGLTTVGTLQYMNRFESADLMSSVSAYFSLPEVVNWYVNLGWTKDSDFLPDFRMDIQAQTEIVPGISLIAGVSSLSFPDEQTRTYSLGAEHYFSGDFSTSYQYSTGKQNSDHTSSSHLLKVNWYKENLTSTVGFTWGDEIFQTVGSEEPGEVKTQGCFSTLTYWFEDNTGFKLNLSYNKRIESYSRIGIGCGLVYKF